MKDITLNGRLFSASELVRQDAHFADIGTDHAYLPIFLLKSGRVKSAICTDINEGPLESARKNAVEYGISDGISFLLTDGALALSDRALTDVSICGMGGELIADIIDRAPFLRSSDIHLILQPMTKQSHLRNYLYTHGFDILTERYSEDAGRFYVTILAIYTGVSRNLTDDILEIGLTEEGEPLSRERREYLTVRQKSILRAIKGKELAGENCENERMIYDKITLLVGQSDGGKD